MIKQFAINVAHV